MTTERDIIARCDLAGHFLWRLHAGINCIALRDRGAAFAAEVWRHVMLGQQADHYRDGMRKLGIRDDEPPAIRAGKYHYFSNSVGGLRLHYVEESPRKVWIRYLAPLGSYPGMSMLASPIELRRTILSTWHPRNGELMGCPRLGWVLTKLVSFGEPYDEGYFYEYDHDLRPEERVRFEHVERTPEFDPAKAPKLSEDEWPPIRIAKGSRNYARGYVREIVEALRVLVGGRGAEQMVATAAACIAVQFTPELVAAAGVRGNDVDAIANLYTSILTALEDDFDVERPAPGRVRIRLRSLEPFPTMETAGLRDALFQFHVVAARMLNGHVRVTRSDTTEKGAPGQVWEIHDTGQWLW
jgi:hypothetical protein